MMHKELGHEVSSVDSASSEVKVEGNESVQPKVEGETAVKGVTQAEARVETEDSEQTEVRLDTEMTHAKALRRVSTGVSEATEPVTGPSNEGQSKPVERSGCANSAIAWAGDKSVADLNRLQNAMRT